MAGGMEAARKLGMSSELAALQLVNLATVVATKVVMMGLSGDLIPQGFPGHRDRRKPVTLQ